MPHVDFHVPGIPQPAGSKTGYPIRRSGGQIGVAIVDANKKAKPWQAEIKALCPEQEALWRGPVSIDIIFQMPRPKSHYGTGKNAARLKPSAPLWHTSKPDALKLARAVEDALTGVLWADDAQIVRESITKAYGDRAGVDITAGEIVELR